MSRTGIARVDFYFDDWLTGTFELDPDQRGAFITICALIWKTGDRLADNDDAVARWIGVKPRRWRELKSSLITAGKIAIDGGFIRQKRAADELAVSRERYANAQKRGQKSQQKRSHFVPIQNDNSLEDNETTASQSQSTNTNTLSKKESKKDSCSNGRHPAPPPANVRQLFQDPPAPRPNGHQPAEPTSSSGKPDGDFDRFYAAYPRKVGKGQAQKAYVVATKRKANHAVIMAGLARAVDRWACDGTEGQFIPHPSTWLNGERWADDPLPLMPARRAVADYRERHPEEPG